jgi:hypothetical protein
MWRALAVRRPHELVDPRRRDAGGLRPGCLAPGFALDRRLRLVGSIGGLDVEGGLRMSGRSALPSLDVLENVFLADPAADAGAAHVGEVDAVLVRDSPHDR